MTEKEAQDLAARMRGAKVETKVGQVNGRYLVHAIITVPRTDGAGDTRTSVNITTPQEWEYHELRPSSGRKRPARTTKEHADQLANESAVQEALTTVYEP